jgi:hypothetical protein
MPIYFFNLKTAEDTIGDPDGTDLPNDSAACEHAQLVARELMQHRQLKTRSWRMDVCDGEREHCVDLLFASVDDSIDHLSPELRSSVEELCAKSSSLCETIRAIRLTVAQVRGTIARSEGALYVATINGVAVDNKTADNGSAA